MVKCPGCQSKDICLVAYGPHENWHVCMHCDATIWSTTSGIIRVEKYKWYDDSFISSMFNKLTQPYGG